MPSTMPKPDSITTPSLVTVAGSISLAALTLTLCWSTPAYALLASDAFNSAESSSCGPPTTEAVPLSDADGLWNLARLKTATVTVSSTLSGYPDLHTIAHLNDGLYNNCRSWISGQMPAWVEIDLGAAYLIDHVTLGSEHTAYFKDRSPTGVEVFIRGVDGDTRATLTHGGSISGTTELAVSPPVVARSIRIEIASSSVAEARIDELEVWGREPRPVYVANTGAMGDLWSLGGAQQHDGVSIDSCLNLARNMGFYFANYTKNRADADARCNLYKQATVEAIGGTQTNPDWDLYDTTEGSTLSGGAAYLADTIPLGDLWSLGGAQQHDGVSLDACLDLARGLSFHFASYTKNREDADARCNLYKQTTIETIGGIQSNTDWDLYEMRP